MGISIHKLVSEETQQLVKYEAASTKKVYIGGTEYANNISGKLAPSRLQTEEGHILPRENWTETSPLTKYVYYYTLSDHLGNARLLMNDDQDAEVVQSNSYSAFGLLALEPDVLAGKFNNRFYNGKEKQEGTGWLDFGMRMYYSELGRWMTVDPKPNHSMSLYVAMNNNPVLYLDPLGDTTIVNNKGTILQQYGGENIIYQQGKKGKLTQIGEFGKSVNLNGILPSILKDNKEAAKKMGALSFANAVKPGGKWDYKDASAQKGNIFGATAKFDKANETTTSFTAGKLNFIEGGSDVGNYNYGFTGRYVGGDGYSPLKLWGAGGVLQTGKDFMKLQWGKAISELGTMIPTVRPPFGDEIDDFIWTTTGMIHADNEKKGSN